MFLPISILAAIVVAFTFVGMMFQNSDATPGRGHGKPTKSPTATASATPGVYNAPVNNTCSTDVTSALNSWIATVPNNSELRFTGCYLINGTVEFRGRVLTFNGQGSNFVSNKTMTPGVYADDQRAMFRAVDSTVRFTNMNLDGAYTAGGTLDESLQHAHAIDFRGSAGTVDMTTITDFAGDCVYYGLSYNGTTKSSGSFHDSSCQKTGRNGVSFTASNNVSVYNNDFNTNGFTVFDVEPNVGVGWGTSNTSITGNTVGTYRLYVLGVIENAPNVGVSFVANQVVGSKGLKIGVVAPGGTVRAKTVEIKNNTAIAAVSAPAIEANNVDGLIVTGNVVPMSGGTMAIVTNSTQVNVSGNSYPGGTREVEIR